MAAAVGLSPRQVQRAFASLGVTPSQYLLGKRLEHAIELLSRGPDEVHDRISAIAFQCGFNDVSYFNRKFREAFGMSPREWRFSRGCC
jgi:AraC-like DNA-binding protein